MDEMCAVTKVHGSVEKMTELRLINSARYASRIWLNFIVIDCA